MPTKHERRTVLYLRAEVEELERQAREEGNSFSNVARQRQGLPPFERGGKLKPNPSAGTLYQRARRRKLRGEIK